MTRKNANNHKRGVRNDFQTVRGYERQKRVEFRDGAVASSLFVATRVSVVVIIIGTLKIARPVGAASRSRPKVDVVEHVLSGCAAAKKKQMSLRGDTDASSS